MKPIKLKDLTNFQLGQIMRAALDDDKPGFPNLGSKIQRRGAHTKWLHKYHSFVVAATVDQLKAELKRRMVELGWPEYNYHELAAARACRSRHIAFEAIGPGVPVTLEYCGGTYFGSGSYQSNYGIHGETTEIHQSGRRDNGFCVMEYFQAKVWGNGVAVQVHNSGNRTIYYCA